MNNHDFEQTYNTLLRIAYNHIKPFLDNFDYVEGNILSAPDKFDSKIYNIYYCAKSCNKHMKALEIGFNAGFSTILMLLANPNLHVYAVDICEHSYVQWCADYVQKLFPNRFTFLRGDSKDVVPRLDHHQFDLIHIDGDHSLEGAVADIHNTLRISSVGHTVIILDDTDIVHIRELWQHAITQGYIDNLALPSPTPYHVVGRVISFPS